MSFVRLEYFVCDRCGADTRGDSDPMSHGWAPLASNLALHLCPSCNHDFVEWFAEKKERR